MAPRVETLARGLLLAVNTPIYRLQRQQAPGQYPGLGFLLDQLRTIGLTEDWYRNLLTILTHAAGLNLRNELAHGFMPDLDRGNSALMLQCAAHLALMRWTKPGSSKQETTGEPSD